MEIQWSLVFYSLFLGIAIGPFAIAALTDCLQTHPTVCKWGSIVALVSIVLGGIAAFTHLGQPLHAINAMNNLGSSLARETLVTLLTGLVAAVWVGQMFFGFLSNLRRIVVWIGLVGTVLSVLLIGATYMVPARPMWNSWLLPLTWLASSIPLGVLTMILVAHAIPRAKGEQDRMPVLKKLVQWVLIALVVYAVIAALYLLVVGSQSGALARLISGDLALTFWLGLVVFGLAAPLVMVWLARRSPDSPRLAEMLQVAFFLVLVSGIVIRAMMFALGTRVPLLPS